MLQPRLDIERPESDAAVSSEEFSTGGRHACTHCFADLNRLPAKARFCPYCGRDVEPKASQPDAASGGSSLSASKRTPTTAEPAGEAVIAAGAGRSPMLSGFARAMYRLGIRYEAGLGAANNSDEARRCYAKAAKLGNPEAIARITGVRAGESKGPPPDTSQDA